MSLAALKAKRWLQKRRGADGPMSALLEQSLPEGRSSLDDVEFLAVDIETTGLDAASADMLSIGWVVVSGQRVCLPTAETCLVRSECGVGASATVHGLTDTMVLEGESWGEALDRVVTAVTGRVLLVHHAGLDKTLLDRLCIERYGCPLLVPVVDTLALEHRRRSRQHHIEQGQQLNLPALREYYHLPRYAAHDCLVDAISTAELLLAMRATHKLLRLSDLL